MKYYFSVLRKYAVFNGRARRKEFWIFGLIDFIIILLAIILDITLGTAIKYNHNGFITDTHYGYIYWSYILALFIPRIALFVRRMHDLDKSGWLALLLLIPIAGALIGFVLALIEGSHGTNKYGPDPKGEYY